MDLPSAWIPPNAAAPPPPAQAPDAKTKKPRKTAKRAAPLTVATKADVEAAVQRKKRSPDSSRKAAATRKARTPAPRGKLGMNEIISAAVGLKEEEAAALLGCVEQIQTLKKSAKPKVVAALGRLFA